MQTYVDEWFSPNFLKLKSCLFSALLLAVLLALGLPRRDVLRAREVLLLLATMWMALRSVRHIPIFCTGHGADPQRIGTILAG